MGILDDLQKNKKTERPEPASEATNAPNEKISSATEQSDCESCGGNFHWLNRRGVRHCWACFPPPVRTMVHATESASSRSASDPPRPCPRCQFPIWWLDPWDRLHCGDCVRPPDATSGERWGVGSALVIEKWFVGVREANLDAPANSRGDDDPGDRTYLWLPLVPESFDRATEITRAEEDLAMAELF